MIWFTFAPVNQPKTDYGNKQYHREREGAEDTAHYL